MASKQEENVARSRSIFECGVCGKSFPAYAKLINHERVHTGEKPFACHICCRAFKQSGHLKRHQKVHTNQRPHDCRTCKRSFKHKAHLTRHIKSHHSADESDADASEMLNQSDESGEASLSGETYLGGETSLNGEQVNRHAEGQYKCQVCSKVFKRKYNLSVHERKHSENKVFKCDVCGEPFSEFHEVAVHRKIHTDETVYQCPNCDKEFATKSILKYHIRTTHSCGKPDIDNPDIDKPDIDKSNVKPHVCDVCGSGFTHSRSLTTHRKMHSGEMKYNCEICGKLFIRTGDLVVHRRMHTGERPYECEICCKAFKQKGHVVKHKKTVHGGKRLGKRVNGNISTSSRRSNSYTKLRSKSEVRLGESEISDETLCTHDNFTSHNGAYIEEENCFTSVKEELKPEQCPDETRSHTCDTCGKSYTQKSYLSVHQRIHTGEMPYGCDICGQAFRQRSHMVKHKKAIHNVDKASTLDNLKFSPNEVIPPATQDGYIVFQEQNGYDDSKKISRRRPFQCEICHKKFRQRSYLNIHMRIHNGEMPYKCNICNRAFRQKTHVVKHKRTVHKLWKTKTVAQLKDFQNETNNHHKEIQNEYVEKTSAGEIFTNDCSMVSHREIFETYSSESTSISGTVDVDKLKCDESSSVGKLSNASVDKPHACEVCGRAFKRKTYLVIHNRMHTGERPYKCIVCARSFRQDCHLRVHMAKMHPNEYLGMQSRISRDKQNTYKCRFCGRVYKRLHLLKQHEKIHDVQEFSESPKVPSHLPFNHGGGKLYKCQFCPKTFDRRQHYTSHERVHTGARPYVCSVCGNAYKQSSHLARHTRKQHNITRKQLSERCALERDDKPHKCRTCTKTFKSKKGLLYHTARCGSTAKVLTARKGRSCVKTHTKNNGNKNSKNNRDKLHECKKCGKNFVRKQLLVVHQRVHTGEKPYECDQCGKSFAIPGNLQRHKVIHTGQKPFVCKICGKGCTQKSNLEAHIRLIHNVKSKVKEFTTYRHKQNIVKRERHKMDDENETGAACRFNNFNETSTATVNEIVEHGIKEEPKDLNGEIYRCCECGKVFDQANSMMEHCLEAH